MRNLVAVAAVVLLLLAGALIAAGTTPVQSGNSSMSTPANGKIDLKGKTDAIDIPQLINYQGKLTDGSGNPITGARDMTFRLYGGVTQFWTETQTGVSVSNGVFNVLLGSGTPIGSIPDGGNCSLEVVVAGVTISPKVPLVSVPYTYAAEKAATVDDGAITMPKINQSGAATGEVIKWTGSAWAPGPDNTGGGSGVTNVYQGTGIICTPNPITSTGTVALDPASQPWVRGSPDSVIFTVRQLGLVRGGCGNTIRGTDPFSYVNFGVGCTTGTNGLQTTGITISGGVRHFAPREYSTIAGGFYNNATQRYTTIGGGDNNRAYGDGSTIAGGHDNQAGGYGSFVGGGGITGLWPSGNTAGGNYAAVVGGTRNQALADYAFIGSGNYDSARATYSSVASGLRNRAGATAADTGAFVGGGRNNQALGRLALVVGGHDNMAVGYGASVGGGGQDSAGGYYSTVTGGYNNRAGYNYSTVGGGANNTADNYGATVGGGWDNHATGWGATVAGGGIVNLSPSGNTASGNYSTVAGGVFNRALANYATVCGGYYDSAVALYSGALSGNNNNAGLNIYDTAALVAGGARNRARYQFACVTGGADNLVNGYYGFVGGGWGDSAVGNYATICGGNANYASGNTSFIGGGYSNRATGGTSAIAGGYDNSVAGTYSCIGGGYRNSITGFECAIAGGQYNGIGSNYYCAIPGGYRDSIFADYGFATNYRSLVPTSYTHSAAFNGTVVTASSQLRCNILSKTSGSFTIDHPLDPEGKILNHYFVESPDMSNLYQGEVVLDGSGRAEVTLPDYFSALNRAPRVQLTGVGTYEVYVAEDIRGNRFTIGGKPGAKVYWLVTGARQDQGARITEAIMPVEQPKVGALRDRSLDDDFLLTTKDQLDRMGIGDQFHFRTAAGQQRYEDMKKTLREAGEK